MFIHRFVMQYFVFFCSLTIILIGRESCSFTLIVFLMSCGCYCSVTLPHSVVDWSAVCDCVST